MIMMNLKVILTPINLQGQEEAEQRFAATLTPKNVDTEICYSVKCRSPFAKFKTVVVIDWFDDDNNAVAAVQATFCDRRHALSIVNKDNCKNLTFDGFVKADDEGTTVPHIIGPLFSLQKTNDSRRRRRVVEVVEGIQRKQTELKVFINQANNIGNKWGMLKELLFNYRVQNESVLLNDIANFIKCNDNTKINDDDDDDDDDDDINSVVRYNTTKWVPELNYVTGRRLLNVLFIFKFK
ncbi:cyun134 [Cyclophragma undans nucleopolyhedrovirus]|uniref:Cyun134 n=1 Tax=Cyclophragma undans nucleopolyhedrovirus TaxID=1906244 RepID=A0A288QZP9_9ABAC|nr:cyun134 [Cyclophragma undans nucleopolyhedrovirus]AOT85592.1 cyun134 [Cyclophragma undans nucleopolyhedrovirus]